MTMLLIVGAMKFEAFVVRMAGSSSSTEGTTMMDTVGAEMFSGLTCKTSSWNDCAQVARFWENGDGRGYDLWEMGMIIPAWG